MKIQTAVCIGITDMIPGTSEVGHCAYHRKSLGQMSFCGNSRPPSGHYARDYRRPWYSWLGMVLSLAKEASEPHHILHTLARLENGRFLKRFIFKMGSKV
ncbi:hypothetical protein H5410_045694 [Solanum commersonii]|uniref:Uncharacterized protein n=1 Tax=Solanum commersonii TaxID=4109 RepID=A0A9J5XDH5_SOLCO|nr:hypothetical protein H5410_045694 [Solanum commersonii]